MKHSEEQQDSATSSLTERVERLDQYFDLRRIGERPDDHRQVVEYYKKSAWGYSTFHSANGSIHMALSENAEFSRDGYYSAPDRVWKLLEGEHPRRVLELGCGTGFNLERMGVTAPTVNFHGIDLTPRHVRAANARLAERGNVVVEEGNFEALPYRTHEFDSLFSIESFCHALSLETAFSEAHRVLKPGGIFVLVDAWRTSAAASESQALLEALSLTERSMAVAKTEEIGTWLDKANLCGFELVSRTNLSREVMPNLLRFESLAKRFMKHRRLARLLGKTFRPRLLENVIAGYLMAESVRSGYHTYELLVLRSK